MRRGEEGKLHLSIRILYIYIFILLYQYNTLTETEEIKAVKTTCSKCNNDNDKESTYNFSHIQDLCPADRKRISLLIKHLAK